MTRRYQQRTLLKREWKPQPDYFSYITWYGLVSNELVVRHNAVARALSGVNVAEDANIPRETQECGNLSTSEKQNWNK